MTTDTFAGRVLRPPLMLPEALAASIRERLCQHEFAPGSFLDEVALAARYGTERQPVATALGRLARERLLLVLPEGGYCVARYARADIEDLLTALESIRLAMLLRQALYPGNAAEMETVALSPYWGMHGLAVAPVFALMTSSLYGHLRQGIGPVLAVIEAACAQECGASMEEAVASGESGRIEACCEQSARSFRQRTLAAFDATVSGTADGTCARCA